MIWQGLTGLFEAHPGTPVRSAPIPRLFLRLEVSIPGVLGVPMKVIVVHGELRETIQDVFGTP